MKRVAIVGGGPGGLFSALSLEQKSSEALDITVFEASGRLGGKVRTKRFDAAPILYEAGVAELYRYGEDVLWLLVTRLLGLPVVKMGGEIVVFEDKVLRTHGDVARAFGPETAAALRAFRRRGRAARPYDTFFSGSWPADNRHPWAKLSLRELLRRVPDSIARRYIEVLIHSDLATEPHVTSGLFGIDNYLINEQDYCQLYSIEGGIERLVSSVAERLSARVELDARVLEVERGGGERYRLLVESGGRARTEMFDAVAVALPVYALRQVGWGGSLLRRAAERHIARYDDPAHYLRITALFREPFWRGAMADSYFIHDAFGGCCVYDEGARHPAAPYGALSWLLGGNDALALSALPDEELIRRAVASFPAQFTGGKSPREELLEGHVHRFIGMVSGRPGGSRVRGSRKRHRVEPKEHGGLFFVGDYLFDSTVNGAYDSANIVSSMLLEHLGITPKTLGSDYFDAYCGGELSYEQAAGDAFDAHYVIAMIQAVWGARPPYRLLDAGSASGAGLSALRILGVDAWGIENNWEIHARTPARLRGRNVLGDVWKMPFPDGHFDFVHETCLCHVPETHLDAALAELRRVTKRGLMLGSAAFGGFAAGERPSLFKRYGPLQGVVSAMRPEEWCRRLSEGGFRPSLVEVPEPVREVERRGPRGRPLRLPRGSLKYVFYEKG